MSTRSTVFSLASSSQPLAPPPTLAPGSDSGSVADADEQQPLISRREAFEATTGLPVAARGQMERMALSTPLARTARQMGVSRAWATSEQAAKDEARNQARDAAKEAARNDAQSEMAELWDPLLEAFPRFLNKTKENAAEQEKLKLTMNYMLEAFLKPFVEEEKLEDDSKNRGKKPKNGLLTMEMAEHSSFFVRSMRRQAQSDMLTYYISRGLHALKTSEHQKGALIDLVETIPALIASDYLEYKDFPNQPGVLLKPERYVADFPRKNPPEQFADVQSQALEILFKSLDAMGMQTNQGDRWDVLTKLCDVVPRLSATEHFDVAANIKNAVLKNKKAGLVGASLGMAILGPAGIFAGWVVGSLAPAEGKVVMAHLRSQECPRPQNYAMDVLKLEVDQIRAEFAKLEEIEFSGGPSAKKGAAQELESLKRLSRSLLTAYDTMVKHMEGQKPGGKTVAAAVKTNFAARPYLAQIALRPQSRVASLTDKNHRASRVSSVYGADEKGNPLFMNAAEPSSCARPPSHPIQRVRVPTLLANIDDAEQEDSQDGKDPFGD